MQIILNQTGAESKALKRRIETPASIVIACTIGQEDKKLLLFDDFNCWNEGVLM